MYVDPGIAALRNHLISLIYTDANERASEESAEDIPLKIAV